MSAIFLPCRRSYNPKIAWRRGNCNNLKFQIVTYRPEIWLQNLRYSTVPPTYLIALKGVKTAQEALLE